MSQSEEIELRPICPLCDGTGKVMRRGFALNNGQPIERMCHVCAGRGWMYLPADQLTHMLEAERARSVQPMLITSFLEAMSDICEYGFQKYGPDSFQAHMQANDRSRYMDRVSGFQLRAHMRSHIAFYGTKVRHDHFGTLKHQLAAVAVNAMMEYYFADLEAEQPDMVIKTDAGGNEIETNRPTERNK